MWRELKENKHFERIPKRKETQVALLMVASKRYGTPRPPQVFFSTASVKQDAVKAAMQSMASREVPLSYSRLVAIQGRQGRAVPSPLAVYAGDYIAACIAACVTACIAVCVTAGGEGGFPP